MASHGGKRVIVCASQIPPRPLEAWRLGGWRFGASGILERRHRRCLEGTWERWAPAFFFAEVNSKVCRHVFVCVCVCVCVCVSSYVLCV